MSEFIGYTIGLEANREKLVGKMVKIECTRLDGGNVMLRAVSGRDLSKLPGSCLITANEWENRPSGNVAEARWALGMCDWTLMADDAS